MRLPKDDVQRGLQMDKTRLHAKTTTVLTLTLEQKDIQGLQSQSWVCFGIHVPK